jgi:hypothetical protein
MGHERSSRPLDLYTRRTDNPERILELSAIRTTTRTAARRGFRLRYEAVAPEMLRLTP